MPDAMHATRDELAALTDTVLNDRHPVSVLRPAVLSILAVIKGVACWSPDPNADIAKGETRTDNGLAISPTMAAMCADDYARTAVFLRGLHQAIQDCLREVPNRPVRVLYAGCGPLALLAVPLMSVFSPEKACFELIDIHGESIESARSIVSAFGFEKSAAGYRVVDAAHYQVNPAGAPDIIVLEVMNTILEKEPQVAVTRHLCEQAPHARLVPQSVCIEAKMANVSREFALSGTDTTNVGQPTIEAPQRERESLGTVFKLDRQAVEKWRGMTGGTLPAGTVEIPAGLGSRFQALLFTTITTYAAHRLSDYDSGLTIPRPFPLRENIQIGAGYQFSYQLGTNPGLTCRVYSSPDCPV